MNEPTQEQAAVVVAQPQSLSVSQAMRLEDILAQVKLIQDVMHRVMKEKEHYGSIPGCGDKKTLLQPGAQKLTMTFRLAPAYEIQEVNLERGHKEYRVICTLKSIQSGSFVGQGVGVCSTMESKYRFRQGARKCPKCGKENTIIKGKAEYGGGWLCFGKKGGCGEKWPDGAKEIEDQQVDKVENENPADCYNTVLKIAKKRAFVDATITATAASDIFTQDTGDEESSGNSRDEYLPTEPKVPFEGLKPASEASEEVKPSQSSPPTNKTSPSPSKASTGALSEEDQKRIDNWNKYRMKLLNKLEAAPGQRNRVLLTDYLTSEGILTVDQVLEDWPIASMPATKEATADLIANMQNYEMERGSRGAE